ncbi:hypothetical protein AKJ50_00210 [candidate division MSBL1 archaeon SCGC-AAA382A13]|uniref:3-phosphoshikimate 1-carboxyvinyltransferase n=1 Tax=candidate division MSBL1 archaeon SCGC-AAA382A13 TaxID=1698279 RepID=A0A133VGX4_9EURY|nr:hypothetical protein AKJ50_00210 [candidate division MSBL1 archaeon SCGC-AAA382A13]
MKLIVEHTDEISGSIAPAPSKFYTQYSTAIALLAEGKSVLESPLVVDDTRDLAKAVETLGGTTKRGKKKWSIWGNGRSLQPSGQVVNAKKSIMSLSLLASISALTSRIMVITGKKQVRNPSVPSLISSLQKLGVDIHSANDDDSMPFVIFQSDLKGGEISLDEDMNPFFMPAFLLLTPFTEEETLLDLNSKIKSRFLDESLELLNKSGIETSIEEEKLEITPGELNPINVTPPLDIFSMVPFVTAAIITDSDLEISKTGDARNVQEFLELLSQIDIEIEKEESSIIISGSQEVKAAEVDLKDFPELLPYFAVLGCFADGETEIVNAERARQMKSDRIEAIVNELNKLGANISEKEDGVIIEGPSELKGGKLDGYDDFTMVAALGVAGFKAEEKTIIKNRAEALRQSHPHFVTDFKDLGGNIGYET